MNKQNTADHGTSVDYGAEPGPAPDTITESMNDPAFTADQLPALWLRATVIEASELVRRGGGLVQRRNSWRRGIENLFGRCETYPQHAAIMSILSSMPGDAWHDTEQTAQQGTELAEQATPDDIQHALAYEQQHPAGWWRVSDHIIPRATPEQLIGPVIEKLEWNGRFLPIAAARKPPTTETERDRWTRIVEHIQQRLLNGNDNAWAVFQGIVSRGTVIGEAAELANAIEHQRRPGPTTA